MMTDKLLRFLEEKTLTDGLTSEVLDLGPPDAGIGRNMDLFVTLKDAPATDMKIDFMTSEYANMAAPLTPRVFNIPADEVEAGGKVVRDRIPTGCLRFVQLKLGGPASGTVSAGLVKDS